MKYAIALIVILGFVAALEAAPAPAETLIEGDDSQDSSQIAETNCDKMKKSDAAADTDGATGTAAGVTSSGDSGSSKMSKKGKKGKGGKKDKKKDKKKGGKGNDDEQGENEQ